MRHLPHALCTWAGRQFFGTLPELPWWPYPAIEKIDSILKPSSIVLEYGTGTSTIWMAARVARIHAIEGSAEWCEKIRSIARQKQLDNVVLHLRDSSRFPERGRQSATFNDEFASLDNVSEAAFDFVVVDGAARWRCVEEALPKLKPGAYLYLDNSDADKDWCHYVEPGQSKLAQALLESAVARGEGSLERLRGLCPATPLASEGTLFRKA